MIMINIRLLRTSQLISPAIKKIFFFLGAKKKIFVTPYILNSEKNENILIKQNKDTCDKKGLG